MSSPSSSGSGKRKRTVPTSIAHSSTADLLQPSSRDASGEDAGDSTSQAVTSNKHRKATTATDTSHPPTKRPRTRSNAAVQDASTSNDAEAGDGEQEKAESTRSRRRAKSNANKDQSAAQLEERDAMPPPAKGGLQDPVGFHTNPPPTGRAVRIYADGVFDLFHLGYDSFQQRHLLRLNISIVICVNSSKPRMLSRTYTYSLELPEMPKLTSVRV